MRANGRKREPTQASASFRLSLSLSLSLSERGAETLTNESKHRQNAKKHEVKELHPLSCTQPKQSLPTVSQQFMPHMCPHQNYLQKYLQKCLPPPQWNGSQRLSRLCHGVRGQLQGQSLRIFWGYFQPSRSNLKGQIWLILTSTIQNNLSNGHVKLIWQSILGI